MSTESPKHIPYGDVHYSNKEKLFIGTYVADIFASLATVAVTVGASDGSFTKMGIGAVALAAEVGYGYFGMKKISAYIDRSQRLREASLPTPPKDIR